MNGSSTETKSEIIAVPITKATRNSYKYLLVERREQILCVKFNRPTVKNALNRRSYFEIMRILQKAALDNGISMVVFTAVGDTYSAGNDLAQLAEYGNTKSFNDSANLVHRLLVKSFINCPKVLVALVNGPCLGISFTMSALCDVVYCTDNTYFYAPFTRIGISPEACSSYTLPLVLGRSKATEVLLFGEKLTAEQALQYKFVSHVYKREEVDSVLWPKLFEYSKLPRDSLLASKRLLRTPQREGMLKALAAEALELERLRKGPVYAKIQERFTSKYKQKANKSKL